MFQRGTYDQHTTSILIEDDSIDETIKMIKKTCGKYLFAKIPIADFAFFTQINDTEGNLISLWEVKI